MFRLLTRSVTPRAAGVFLLMAAVAAVVGSSQFQSARAAAPQIPSHIKGVVPVIGKQLPGAGIPLTYHGGPVMTTNKTYAIYWKPAGYTMASGYDTTINQYFTDVAADSGKSTNVYAAATQYSSIQYSSSVGGSFTDTNAFPASGCPLYNGLPECLTDAQIQTEVNSVIASKGWVKNGTNMFFMFTPQNVGSCFDSQGRKGARSRTIAPTTARLTAARSTPTSRMSAVSAAVTRVSIRMGARIRPTRRSTWSATSTTRRSPIRS